jgi:hypothetical protein
MLIRRVGARFGEDLLRHRGVSVAFSMAARSDGIEGSSGLT